MEKEHIVWNKITDSTKRRVHYDALVAALEGFGDCVLPENLLFQIIIGLAAGEDKDTIAAKLESHLTLLGIGVENGSLVDLIDGIEPAVVEGSFAIWCEPGPLAQTTPVTEKSARVTTKIQQFLR